MKAACLKIAAGIVAIIAGYSCNEEISINVPHNKEIIIYGEMTNEIKPVSIFIQQSVALNSSAEFEPINNAQVSLHTRDTSGSESIVTNNFNVDSGTYVSAQPITPIIDNLYWIEVTMNDGTQFNSAEEVLKPVVKINQIEIIDEYTAKIIFEDPADDNNFYKINAAELTIHEDGSEIRYNRYRSAFSDVVINGNKNASVEIDFLFNLLHNQTEITLGNINSQSYQFLLNLEIQEDNNDNEDGKSDEVFSAPPASLLGNITNTTTGYPALGNFSVLSVNSKVIQL